MFDDDIDAKLDAYYPGDLDAVKAAFADRQVRADEPHHRGSTVDARLSDNLVRHAGLLQLLRAG